MPTMSMKAIPSAESVAFDARSPNAKQKQRKLSLVCWSTLSMIYLLVRMPYTRINKCSNNISDNNEGKKITITKAVVTITILIIVI